EAKERVRIKEENQTLATITLQNYFRLYEKLAGMTGTAETEAGEFAHTYNLPVVPIPTNMPMIRADHQDLIYKSEEAKFQPDAESPESQARYAELFPRYADECAAEGVKVIELGGLYVLGTERHESRRIDNQLRGRSGRQGDPGESRFYLSLEDDLMRLFATGMVDRMMSSLKIPDDMPIESKLVSRSIARAQHQREQQNFEIRKNVLKYDDVINKQREAIYQRRNEI